MKSQLCVCWKFSFCISMEIHSLLLLKKRREFSSPSEQHRLKMKQSLVGKTLGMCMSFFSFLSYCRVYCPHKGLIPPRLFLHGLLNMWEGLLYVHLICESSGKALFFSSLCVLCFSSCSCFLAVYSNIYLSCFIVSSG